MRILYGVQGTGNGHLTRARVMREAFADRDCQVDWLFSGRPRERFFDMEAFGDFRSREGLTFVNRHGRVDYLRTVLGNRYHRFIRDVWRLDVHSYDLIISDFEPICAWAGRLRGRTVISLGHQPAFDYGVPVAERDLRTTLVMRLFAPGDVRLGMHWNPFGAPLLPPLVDVTEEPAVPQPDKVLVYLPFEDQDEVIALLETIPGYEFYVYAPGLGYEDRGRVHQRPTSVSGFRADLEDCTAVLCNAGFELSSECLALGKRLLVKPQGRQMEQASNALALRELGYGESTATLDRGTIERWLQEREQGTRLEFPDVAAALVDWILAGDYSPRARWSLCDKLWHQVRVNGHPLRRGPGFAALIEAGV